eukprot:TRINITY_DN65860_c0_g1_i1.p1 TRINITY_DN65860_c0_g1~~TRINITY_DN65860_c0_g1_i1.p1  ORF type:complete len:230 (+),score=18.66 TRINITY_DN65860_c0_g1_i1:74-763(+)
MWDCNYVICSIYIDFMFLSCALLQDQLGVWFLYSTKCAIKVAVLVMLAWIYSSRSLEVSVTVFVLSTLMLFLPYILLMVSDRQWRALEVEFLTTVIVNRICEAPLVLSVCVAQLGEAFVGRGEEQDRVSREKVVPLHCPDTNMFVSNVCTWVELCGSCEVADDAESAAICCICLDRIELNEVVTQLTCRHAFHSECASLWMRRCATLSPCESVCPIRCRLTTTLGRNPA